MGACCALKPSTEIPRLGVTNLGMSMPRVPLEALPSGSACRPAHLEVIWSILHPTSMVQPQDAESSLTATVAPNSRALG